MPKIIEGIFDAKDKKFAIVVARWNQFVVHKLLDGAVDSLKRNQTPDENITIVYCPGAFEIPVVVKKLAESGGDFFEK